jgi:hypothetical protein
MGPAFSRFAALACVVVAAQGCAHRIASSPPQLRSLHLRATTGDATGDDFVFVEPVGSDVRIRVVRVAPASQICPGLLVEAAEQLVPATTVQALASTAVCSLTRRQIDRAHRRAPFRGFLRHFVGRIDAVVADCGGATREFVRTMPPVVDDAKLARLAPEVAGLWQMHPRLVARVIDASVFPDAFANATPDVQARRAALGHALIPDLLAGPYGVYMKRSLLEYRGPASRNPVVVDLVDREKLPLVAYEPPRMPTIALSANVFGDVRLALSVDDVTGGVTGVAVVAGTALLHPAASEAAHRWRFAPGAVPTGRLAVTVRFGLQCGTP